MYEVTVEGEYIAMQAGGVAKAIPYVEEFILPSMDMALSNIQNKLINPRLKQKYENVKSFRTCKISNQKLSSKSKISAKTPVAKMSLAQLEEYTVEKNLLEHVDVNNFGTIDDARKAVQDVEDNIELYEQKQAEKRVKEQEDDNLLALNDIESKNSPVIKDLKSEE